MAGRGGQRKVSIATSLGKDLHLRIDSAVASFCGIGKREITVYKTVAGQFRSFFDCEATVAIGELVSESAQQPSRIFRRVRLRYPMMKVDLSLTPPRMAMVRQNFQQA